MWADERSRIVANALHEFLGVVVQGAHYFLSTQNISSGSDWLAVLRSNLQEAHVGIAVLTPENLDNRWIHFEAGAISKIAGEARVIPLLIDVSPTDLSMPLSAFQWAKADDAGIQRIVGTIVKAMDPALAPPMDVVDRAVRYAKEDFTAAVAQAHEYKAPKGAAAPKRGDREMFEEILTSIRQLQQRPFHVAQGVGVGARAMVLLRSDRLAARMTDAEVAAAARRLEEALALYRAHHSTGEADALVTCMAGLRGLLDAHDQVEKRPPEPPEGA